ncbi:uncharacterized protein [Diadema antillarum]|uniref:uncharacterized protein n=1 Tax=Diadema antillarum TaxID=105358 RepID=UPI003A8AF8CE
MGFALDITLLSEGVDWNENGSDINFIRDGIHDFRCASGLQHIRQVARCDQVIDCHDFSDEIGCDGVRECEDNGFQCGGTDICVKAHARCDGWFDCPLRDDEANCGTERCPRGCQCGASPFVFIHCPISEPCHQQDPPWLPLWANCTEISNWREEDFASLSTGTNILELTGCQITHLEAGHFDGMERLRMLRLSYNGLTYLLNGTFRGLYYLQLLWLENNDIFRIDEGVFTDLRSLYFIDFEWNPVTDFRDGEFADLGNSLERLILTRTNLTALRPEMFAGIAKKLVRLNLQNSTVHKFEPGTFSNMTLLEDLILSSVATTPTQLYPGVFDGLDSLKAMYTNDPRLCCVAPDHAECIVEIPSHPLFTCRRTFLQNTTIKIFIFILAISALVGNSLVIIKRLRTEVSSDVARVQSILITNLAASDLLMGLYMLLLAIMDIYIGESYFWEGRAQEWRSSTPCQVLGFMSVVSSETSVFLLTLISIDRFICIMFPFSTKRLGPTSCRIVVSFIWFLALLIGAASILLTIFDPDSYNLSDVCVGLPFIRKSINPELQPDDRALNSYNLALYQIATTSSISTWRFSIVLFLGINFFSFCLIALSYILIFIKVRFVRTEVGKRTNKSAGEVKMAIRMFLIVGTDFFCWMPIIVLGMLVQTSGITVTPDVYAWLVVFVLPINSSLNPYIYTIIYMISNKENK